MKKLFALIIILIIAVTSASCSILEGLLVFEEAVTAPQASVEGQLMIEVIDVGQGDSILIISPEGKSMLIDCGEADAFDAVCNALDAHGVKTIDWLVATHPHSDHIGCMYKIVDKYDIASVYMPNKSHTSKTYEKLLKSISKKKLKIQTAKEGVSIDMGGSVSCKMYSPVDGKEYSDLNDYSPIMKITFGSTSFITTGDAGYENEADAMAFSSDLNADVLKLGHHGSSTASSEDFLTAVDPSYAVISVGTDNSYGHPHKETVELLKKYGIPSLQTNEIGDIYVYSDGTTIKINEKVIDEDVAATCEVEEYVFKTKSGKYYHKEGCSYLTESAERITKEDAEDQGLKPCQRCDP